MKDNWAGQLYPNCLNRVYHLWQFVEVWAESHPFLLFPLGQRQNEAKNRKGVSCMPDGPEELVLTLGAGLDADSQELAELGRQLRTELLELDVEAVNPVRSGTVPAGAKGDPVTLATLAVTLAPIVVTELMKTVQAWLARHDKATVTVESGGEKITITGSPSKEQQRTLETFITSIRK